MNPLDWSAGPFLALYCALAAVILLWLQHAKTNLPPNTARQDQSGLSVLHIAYLAGGAARAMDAALVGLFEAGAAVFDHKRGVVQIDRFASVPRDFQPFCYVSDGEATRKTFHSQYDMRAARLRAELADCGLVPDMAAVAKFQRFALVILSLPVLLGVAKIVVGSQRDRPVGILTMLVVLTLVLGGLIAFLPPSRSRAGTAALQRLRQDNARAARAPLDTETVLAFALVGATAVDGREYRGFLKQGIGSDSSGSGGCGGGGGGGGGGCGGCSA